MDPLNPTILRGELNSPSPKKYHPIGLDSRGRRVTAWPDTKTGKKPGIYCFKVTDSEKTTRRYYGRSSQEGGPRRRISKHTSLANTGKRKRGLYKALSNPENQVSVAIVEEYSPTKQGVSLDQREIAYQKRCLEKNYLTFNKKSGGGGFSRWDVKQECILYGGEDLPTPSPVKPSRFDSKIATPKSWARLKGTDLNNIDKAVVRIQKQLRKASPLSNVHYEFKIFKRITREERRYVGVTGEFFSRLSQHLKSIAAPPTEADSLFITEMRSAFKTRNAAITVGIARYSIPTTDLFSVEKEAIALKKTNGKKDPTTGLNSTNGGNGSLPRPPVKRRLETVTEGNSESNQMPLQEIPPE